MSVTPPVLACPKCRGPLESGPGAFSCAACRTGYPVSHGIADFRPPVARSIYYDRADASDRLADEAGRLSFSELENLACGTASPFQAAYRRAAVDRGRDHWNEAVALAGGRPAPKGGLALDIGCGPGGNLVALAAEFDQVIGIDVSHELLILARKRVAEAGLAHRVWVMAASADALPFAGGTFGYATAMNVIEHVEDQPGTLAEIGRVLAPGGALFFDSPNRYSLLAEPHVKLWGVGFLPRAWAGPYVRLRKGIGYEGKRLLGLAELRGMLGRAFPRSFVVGIPSFGERAYYPEGRAKKAARRIYNQAVRNTPLVRTLLYPFVPTFNVLARKEGS